MGEVAGRTAMVFHLLLEGIKCTFVLTCGHGIIRCEFVGLHLVLPVAGEHNSIFPLLQIVLPVVMYMLARARAAYLGQLYCRQGRHREQQSAVPAS